MTHLDADIVRRGLLNLGPVLIDGTASIVTNDDAVWLLKDQTWLRVDRFQDADPGRGVLCSGGDSGQYRQALWVKDRYDLRIWLHMPDRHGGRGTLTITGGIELVSGLHPDDPIARLDAER
jgi:hypothetical protein